MRIEKVKQLRRLIDAARLDMTPAIAGAIVRSPKFLADMGLAQPLRIVAPEFPRLAEDSVEDPERWDGLE